MPDHTTYSLHPFMLSTLGSAHPDTISCLRRYAQKLAETNAHYPDPTSLRRALLQSWASRTVIQVHKLNAAMLRRCTGTPASMGLDKP